MELLLKMCPLKISSNLSLHFWRNQENSRSPNGHNLWKPHAQRTSLLTTLTGSTWELLQLQDNSTWRDKLESTLSDLTLARSKEEELELSIIKELPESSSDTAFNNLLSWKWSELLKSMMRIQKQLRLTEERSPRREFKTWIELHASWKSFQSNKCYVQY